jgi:uncharacterized LabA/DUF88 family protein
MNKAIVLIDGENFIYKVEKVLKTESMKINTINIQEIKLKELISSTFKSKIDTNFYAARLKFHPETPKKSKTLLSNQRHLQKSLEQQNIDFIYAGYVRARKEGWGKYKRTVFKEKGVDVRIAVDMVSMACDKKYKRIVLCSSDSDLQPAVAEVKRRGVEIIYLGFKIDPNKGLMYTTDRTILFENKDIISSLLVP